MKKLLLTMVFLWISANTVTFAQSPTFQGTLGSQNTQQVNFTNPYNNPAMSNYSNNMFNGIQKVLTQLHHPHPQKPPKNPTIKSSNPSK